MYCLQLEREFFFSFSNGKFMPPAQCYYSRPKNGFRWLCSILDKSYLWVCQDVKANIKVEFNLLLPALINKLEDIL